MTINKKPKRTNNDSKYRHKEANLIKGNEHKGEILVLTKRVSKMITIHLLSLGKNGKLNYFRIALIQKQTMYIPVDNKNKFAKHKMISKALNYNFYCTPPYSSWKKSNRKYE